MRRFRLLAWLIAAICTAATVSAQVTTGSIVGTVSDTQGQVVPGATVAIKEIGKQTVTTVVTDANGSYTAPFLNPGTYEVEVELTGFKKYVRQGIVVQVNDRARVDASLEVGQLTEVTTVIAAAPLVRTESSEVGTVIEEKAIRELPLNQRNFASLVYLVPGVTPGQQGENLSGASTFNPRGASNFNALGQQANTNGWLVDGIDNNEFTFNTVIVAPSVESVREFKVLNGVFSAEFGRGAGVVSVSTKSGSNEFRGTVFDFIRNDVFDAHNYFAQRTRADGSEVPKPPLRQHQFGGAIGGPLNLPGYKGTNRTFFFADYSGRKETRGLSFVNTVPTAAQRNGDFSDFRNPTTGALIVIYDPLTTRPDPNRPGGFLRDPFPGNVIPPNRINPIAQKVLSYYPLPNQPGDAGGRNNFFYENPRTDDFYSVSTRFDHAIGANQRLMARYTRNDRRESRNAQLGTVNGIVPTGNFLFRKNDGVTVDHTWTQTNTSVWEFRGGWQRFREPNVRQHEGQFDPASLGFSPSVTALFGGANYFPFFDFDTLSDIGDNLAGNTTHTIYSFLPTYTKLIGDHSMRAGYDLRNYREFGANPGRQAGEYVMRNANAFTRQTNSSAAQNFQDLATFLTGFPTAGTIDINAERNNYQWYHAVFVQDDWKLTNKLTLNLGLRYDYEGAPTEQNNANTRGFDPAAILSLTAAAEAAYAARPDVIPPSQWHARGGLGFASSDTPGIYNPDRNNIQPRVGFAYRWNEKTVIRGGWGLYTSPFVFSNGINQMGYSQSTPFTASQNNGLTFLSTLSNPYPSGVLPPVGNSLGPNTFLGQSFSTSPTRVAPVDFQNAQLSRYLVNVQRELPAQWLLEVGYAGSHGYNLTTNEELNAIPAQYLSSSQARDQPNIDFLAALVANPFAGGLLPTGFTAATVARSQLLRPFPQFNNVPIYGDEGTSQYDSAQMKIEKRFTHGYSIIGTYTFSHFTERVFRLNPTDPGFENRLARDDVPHRVTTSLLYELPFGHGHSWGGNASGVVNGLIGGWSVNAIGQFQSGRPLDFESRNIYFNGDVNALKAKYTNDSDAPVFDISGFYFHDALVQTNGVDDPAKQRTDTRIRLVNNLRYFPSRVDGLRSPFLKLWDISIVKQVPLSGRMRAQFNIEFLNAFNVVVFNDANTDPTNADFGKVTSQNNLPRDIQLAAKIIW